MKQINKETAPETVETDGSENKNAPSAAETPRSLEERLEKSLQWSQVIYQQNRQIKRRLTMMVIGNYLRLAIIVAPIVLALIYLPPIIEKLFATYGELLGNFTGAAGGGPGGPAIFGGGLPLNEILSQVKPAQIQELIKSLPQ